MKRALLIAFLLISPQAYAQAWSTQQISEYQKALSNRGRFGVPRYATASLPACSAGSNTGGIAYDTTTNSVKVCTAAGSYVAAGGASGSFSSSLTVGTTTTAGTATTTIDGTMGGAADTDNFLNITGTMPTTMTATTRAVLFSITGAGSSAQVSQGFTMEYLAGYTGGNRTTALNSTNSNAGTSASIAAGNVAVRGLTDGTTAGYNIGASGIAQGSSVYNVGSLVRGISNANTPALNVGIHGQALNATTNVAGYFELAAGTTAPTLTVAALIADNAAVAGSIFKGRDNGTTVFDIADGGTVATGAGLFTREFSGNKANITEASAQVIVRITMPSSGMYGAWVSYTVHDDNGTNFIVRNGSIQVQGANKAGTSVCTINAARDAETEDGSQVVDTGGGFTLTYTWTNVVNTTSCDLSLNAASSAGANTLDIEYKVVMTGSSTATTITAQ